MPATTATITGNITDAAGDAFTGSNGRVKVWLESSDPTSEGTVAGGIRLNAVYPITVLENGDIVPREVPVTVDGAPLYRLHIEGHSGGQVRKPVLGYFDMTEDDDLASIRARVFTPAALTPQVAANIAGALDAATAAQEAQAAAEAARDQAVDISNIDTTDAAVAAGFQIPGSESGAYLSTTYAAGVSLPAPSGGDDRAAIQAVLDTHAGKRIVGVPGASYQISGPLSIQSGTTLVMSTCDITLTAPGQMLRNKALTDQLGGGSSTARDTDIEIVGGTWQRGSNAGVSGQPLTLMNLMFQRVDRLKIRDIRVTSSAGKYAIYLYACTDFDVSESSFATSSDGVHMTGACARGRVAGVYGTTGDDSVAITSNDYADYVNGDLGDVTDILIERVYTTTTANCVKVLAGSVSGTPTTVRNIRVRDIAGTASQGAVHLGGDNLQANTYGGNTIDCTIESVRNLGTGHGVVLFHSTYRGIKLRNVSSPAGASKYAVNVGAGTVAEDITLDGCYWSPPANTPAINFVPNSPYPSVTTLRVINCRYNVATKSGSLITTSHASAVLSNLIVENLVADLCAWALGDFYTNTNVFVVGLRGLNISGWASVRAGGTLDFKAAAGLHANVDHISNLGTVRSRSQGLRCDVSVLAKTAGDMAYNTNAALAIGVGPVVSDGTSWKNLFSGATV